MEEPFLSIEEIRSSRATIGPRSNGRSGLPLGEPTPSEVLGSVGELTSCPALALSSGVQDEGEREESQSAGRREIQVTRRVKNLSSLSGHLPDARSAKIVG